MESIILSIMTILLYIYVKKDIKKRYPQLIILLLGIHTIMKYATGLAVPIVTYAIVVIFFLLTLQALWIKEKIHTDYFILLFIIYSLFYIPVSGNILAGFHGYANLLFPWLIFLTLRSLNVGLKDLRLFFLTFIVISVIQILGGIYQYFFDNSFPVTTLARLNLYKDSYFAGGDVAEIKLHSFAWFRTSSFFLSFIALAFSSIYSFYYGIFKLSKGENTISTVFYTVFSVLALLCLLVTFTRSAYYGLMIGMIPLLINIKLISKRKTMMIFFVVSMLITLTMSINTTLWTDINARLFSVKWEEERSAVVHLVDLLEDGPIFLFSNPLGVGLGRTSEYFYDNVIYSETAYWNIGMQLGIIGLVIFLFVLASLLFALLKVLYMSTDIDLRSNVLLSIMCLIANMAGGLFLPTFYLTYYLLFIIILSATVINEFESGLANI